MTKTVLIALLAAASVTPAALLATSPAFAKSGKPVLIRGLDKADCNLNHGSWINVSGWGWGCAYYK